MRVLLVNTNERTGGAAVATDRLMDALNNNGVKAKMLVANKQTDTITVAELPHPWRQQMCFLWERLIIFLHLHGKKEHLFEIDIANAGADITCLPEFRQADVIHLAWINQGMLSLSSIRKILKSGKPVVWTMHDLWPLSSICHLTLGCDKFKTHCHQCQYLPNGGSNKDLSYVVWERKRRTYQHNNISFVTCSRWLSSEAKASGLIDKPSVDTIPNPINTTIFCRKDKHEARKILELPADKRLILFAAQRATNVNKGMDYLIEACQKLTSQHSDMRDNTAVVILGGHAEEFEGRFDMPVFPLGYINDEHIMVEVYNACDVFVLPSLSENLPNTIMEAMACGTPCVGFNVGGIPEMIDHQRNGYVARYKDSTDLAKGIHWILDEADHEELSRKAVHKVAIEYSQQSVAMRYIEVYNQAMAYKNYSI